jgi:hypothetical protein
MFDPENPPCNDEETMHKLKNESNDWDYGIIFIRWFGDVVKLFVYASSSEIECEFGKLLHSS